MQPVFLHKSIQYNQEKIPIIKLLILLCMKASKIQDDTSMAHTFDVEAASEVVESFQNNLAAKLSIELIECFRPKF